MKRFLIISAALATVALIGIAATLPATRPARDWFVNNTTDTVAMSIQKAGDVSANYLEAYAGSTLKFAIPADGLLDVIYGGTGAATAAGARAALGLSETSTNTTAAGWRTAAGVGEWTTNTASNVKAAIGIQAGSVTTATDGTVTNTFATAFGSAPVVVISPVGEAVSATNNLVSVTESNFVYNAGQDAQVAKWIAVGTP